MDFLSLINVRERKIADYIIVIFLVFMLTLSVFFSFSSNIRQGRVFNILNLTNDELDYIKNRILVLENEYREFSSAQELLSLYQVLPFLIQETKSQNYTLNDYPAEIKSISFYKFSKNTDFTDAGNYTFDHAVYLIGFNAVTCKSGKQKYELIILNENVKNWTAIAGWDKYPDGYPKGPYIVKVYFWASLSSDGHDQVSIMLHPYAGFYIPKDETIYFQIFAKRVGTGGSFTIYYIDADS